MEEQKKKSLSEISHLFLSSVRDNATGGARPQRIPPGRIPPGGERVAPRPAVPPVPRTAMSIDLTPEEYARVIEQSESADRAAENTHLPEPPPIGPVSAVICSQFNTQQLDRAKEYARHLSGSGERIGLLHVDFNECSVTCFETSREQSATDVDPTIVTSPRQLADALNELAWDIDRWVLLLTNPRLPEARAMLRKVPHWVLLSTCDHDGVVSCYRAIKGLADLPRPRLTLALLNAADQTEAGNVYRKIANVCEQFLNWDMQAEPAVEAVEMVNQTIAMTFNVPRERAETAAGPQWEVVGEFLDRANERANENVPPPMKLAPLEQGMETQGLETQGFETPAETPVVESDPQNSIPSDLRSDLKSDLKVEPMKTANTAIPSQTARLDLAADDCDVTDLPTGEVTEAAVLSAVMTKPGSGLIECPIRPPACPQAALAVNRDRRLVLLGVARKGLGELRCIALAYRWVIENRPLLSMAMPQFAIDTHAMPCLKLLVDRADTGADLLLPMSENGNVTVHSYRKLRWAGKTGLLLEAA
jgi:hypothetical protein